MFNQTEASCDQQEFLEQAKSARRGREERKCHEVASVAIQAGARGFLARTRLKRKIRKVSLSRHQGLLGQDQAQKENVEFKQAPEGRQEPGSRGKYERLVKPPGASWPGPGSRGK